MVNIRIGIGLTIAHVVVVVCLLVFSLWNVIGRDQIAWTECKTAPDEAGEQTDQYFNYYGSNTAEPSADNLNTEWTDGEDHVDITLAEVGIYLGVAAAILSVPLLIADPDVGSWIGTVIVLLTFMLGVAGGVLGFLTNANHDEMITKLCGDRATVESEQWFFFLIGSCILPLVLSVFVAVVWRGRLMGLVTFNKDVLGPPSADSFAQF